MLDHLGHGGVDRGLVGDVEPHGVGAAADLGGGRRGAGGVDVADRDGGALGGVGAGEGGADAARGAGDQRRLALEAHGQIAFPAASNLWILAGSGVR